MHPIIGIETWLFHECVAGNDVLTHATQQAKGE